MSTAKLVVVYAQDSSTDAQIEALLGRLGNAGFVLDMAGDSAADIQDAEALIVFWLNEDGPGPLEHAWTRAAQAAGARILCITTLAIATKHNLIQQKGIVPVLLLDDDWEKLWEKLQSRLSGQLSGQFPADLPEHARPRQPRKPEPGPGHPAIPQPPSHRNLGDDDLYDMDIPSFSRGGRGRSGGGFQHPSFFPRQDEARPRPPVTPPVSDDPPQRFPFTEARNRKSFWAVALAGASSTTLTRIDDEGVVVVEVNAPRRDHSAINHELRRYLAQELGVEIEQVTIAGRENSIKKLIRVEGVTQITFRQASVEFSAHYPKEIAPQDWQPLYAYLYRQLVKEQVITDVQAQFGDRTDIRSTTRPASQPVAQDSLVTATPHIDGFEFDPPSLTMRFRKDWRRFDFEFRAVDAPLDAAANGRVTFDVEGVIVADVPLSVFVTETVDAASAAPQESTAKPYDAIFCSYSHDDTAIVERVEAAYKALGHDYLRDITTLRSGQHWGAELESMIDRADIFQLFWSSRAAGSPYVEEEWRHALTLIDQHTKDPHFIRPVRWEEPMPKPPEELAHIHFAYQPDLAKP